MKIKVWGLALLLLYPWRINAQEIKCIQPTTATISDAACRSTVDAGQQTVRFVLQLRTADNKPMPGTSVNVSASAGQIRDTARSDAEGYVYPTWTGVAPADSLPVTIRLPHQGLTTTRQLWIVRKRPSSIPSIASIDPERDHSAFASRYLNHDIEVELATDASTCVKTTVTFEYLTVGTAAAPEPKRHDIPALWSELDPAPNIRYGCAAQLQWILSPAVGKQTLRAWVKRDSTFVLPSDAGAAEQFLHPEVVHAIAHAPPAFLVGAAVVDSADHVSVPKIVGVDLSFPNAADWFKDHNAKFVGQTLDRVRLFFGTEFGGDLGQNIYAGFEPALIAVGPRAADLPVAVVVGRRFGQGDDRTFWSALINASALVDLVAKGLGFGGSE